MKALRRSAFSENPLLASWSVTCLSGAPGVAKSALADLAEECGRLSFAAQVALDEALSRARGEEWTGSKRRTAMLEGWGTKEALERSRGRVLPRLSRAYANGELDATLFFGLIGSIAADTDLPVKARRHALWLMGRSSTRHEGRDKDKALAAVMLVLSGKDDGTDLRRRAARVLEPFFTLSAADRKIVRELREKTSDEELAKILSKALEKKAAGGNGNHE